MGKMTTTTAGEGDVQVDGYAEGGTAAGYEVDEVWIDPQSTCACGSCSHVCLAAELKPVDGCSLTAGDASPAGRCPKCDALAYIADVQPKREGVVHPFTVVFLDERDTPRTEPVQAADAASAADCFAVDAATGERYDGSYVRIIAVLPGHVTNLMDEA